MSESHLLQTYQSKVVPLLQEKYKYKNKHQIPRIKKVTLNIGLGEAIQNPKAIETASKQLAAISGQKPVVTRAKHSIGFGQGCWGSTQSSSYSAESPDRFAVCWPSLPSMGRARQKGKSEGHSLSRVCAASHLDLHFGSYAGSNVFVMI